MDTTQASDISRTNDEHRASRLLDNGAYHRDLYDVIFIADITQGTVF